MSELPDGWAATTLGAVTDLSSGYGFPKKFQGKTSGEVPFAKVRDISFAVQHCVGELDRADHWVDADDLAAMKAKPVAAGSVVFAKIGEAVRLNRRAFLKQATVIDNNCMALSPTPVIGDPRFLLKFMQTVDLTPFAVATTVPSVRRGDVENVALDLPPLPEQRRIVAKLDRLSVRSAAARAHLARTTSLAARAKQAVLGKVFQEEGGAYEASRLGVIASHITSGSRDWARYYDQGDAVFILAGNIRPMAFDARPKRFVDPPRDAADVRRTRIQRDDLLVTIVGANTGDLCRVDQELDDYYVCQSVALIRLAEPWRARFVELFLNSEITGGEQMKEAIYGQGRPHLSFVDLKGFLIPMSDRPTTESIVHRIEAAFARIDRLTEEAARAAHLLDRLDERLLSKAFRGELVPQDPADEPAAALLARIRDARAAAGPGAGKRRRKKARSEKG